MSEELKIEVGEPIPNSFDYSLSPTELDKKLSERMVLVRQGQAAATHELSMLGYALDFIDVVKRNIDVALTFEEESLEPFCTALSALRQSFVSDPPTGDDFNSYVKAATGFFGIMMIRNLGGCWAMSNLGMAIILDGTAVFVMNRVGRYLQGGDDGDNMAALYNSLKK